RSWTLPYSDARSYGRTRPPAGHNGAPTRALAAARPLGNQCGRADAPSPSGRDSKPDAPTTWARASAEPRLNSHYVRSTSVGGQSPVALSLALLLKYDSRVPANSAAIARLRSLAVSPRCLVECLAAFTEVLGSSSQQ